MPRHSSTNALHIDQLTKRKYTYEIWRIQNRWSGKQSNARMWENQSESGIVGAGKWRWSCKREGDGTEKLIVEPDYQVRLEIFVFDSQLRPSENWEKRSSRKLAGMEERERMRIEREREGRLRSYFMRLRPLDLLPSQKLKSKLFFFCLNTKLKQFLL